MTLLHLTSNVKVSLIIVGSLFWTWAGGQHTWWTGQTGVEGEEVQGERVHQDQEIVQHGFRMVKRCIEVTIGNEESFVGVLDHPK